MQTLNHVIQNEIEEICRKQKWSEQQKFNASDYVAQIQNKPTYKYNINIYSNENMLQFASLHGYKGVAGIRKQTEKYHRKEKPSPYNIANWTNTFAKAIINTSTTIEEDSYIKHIEKGKALQGRKSGAIFTSGLYNTTITEESLQQLVWNTEFLFEEQAVQQAWEEEYYNMENEKVEIDNKSIEIYEDSENRRFVKANVSVEYDRLYDAKPDGYVETTVMIPLETLQKQQKIVTKNREAEIAYRKATRKLT